MCAYSDKVVKRCCDTIYSLIDDEELDHVKFLRGVSLIESLLFFNSIVLNDFNKTKK